MFLKFEVFDSNQTAVGNTSVSFDWKAHMWAVNEDKAGAWKRIAAVRSGKFEVKDWGVMWMWDKARNIAIIHDSPKSGSDTNTLNGTARLYDPVDANLKDTIAKWILDPGSAGKVSMVLHKPLPFSRTAYIQRLNMLFPAPYLGITTTC